MSLGETRHGEHVGLGILDRVASILLLAKIRKNWLVHDFVVHKQQWIEVLDDERESR